MDTLGRIRSPKLRRVSWNLNAWAFRFGDEGHPNHHPRTFGELGTLGTRLYGPGGKFPYKKDLTVRSGKPANLGGGLTYMYVPLYTILYIKFSAANSGRLVG